MTHEYKWLEKQGFFFFLPSWKIPVMSRSRKDRWRIESCEPQVLILLLLVSALCIYSRVSCIKLAVASAKSQYFIRTESSGGFGGCICIIFIFSGCCAPSPAERVRGRHQYFICKIFSRLLQHPARTTPKRTPTAFFNIMFLFSF